MVWNPCRMEGVKDMRVPHTANVTGAKGQLGVQYLRTRHRLGKPDKGSIVKTDKTIQLDNVLGCEGEEAIGHPLLGYSVQ